MKKRNKLFAVGMLATTLATPVNAFAMDSSSINIDLEKRTVLLGDKSKISIKFNKKPNSDSITLNYLCYDMELSTNLNYNQETNSYEGEIDFNKDPEYLNVWKIENIVINNNENPQTLNREDLEKLGLKLDDYNVTQEYIVPNMEAMPMYMQKTGAPVKELIGARRHDTSVKISQEGWPNGSNKVIIVNGSAISDGITATPLATTYDAPILLVNKDSIPNSINSEIKRLNPNEIIVVGGNGVVSDEVMNNLKDINSAQVRRISGKNRNETSLKIAQEIDKDHDVNKIYLANGFNGEVDALTIASKAGQDKQPIILTDKYEIPQSTYSWLSTEDLKDAYFIGGEGVIATDVIHQVANITTPAAGQSVYRNRVYGADRHETNANVIKKFYPQEKLNAVLVAKSDVLADALAAGPLAAKLNSPIIINPPTYVSKYHEENLANKSADIVYRVGGGIRDSVIDDIAYKLSERNSGDKTVVLDPGHGGDDSGMVGLKINEKYATLDTSLAASQYLRDNGINVVMTRDTDQTLALGSRTSISNSIKPDLFTSIHYNASNGAGHGIEVFYEAKDTKGGLTKTAATNVLNSVLEKFNLRNRGIKTRQLDDGRDYLYVLRNTNQPAILVECAFLDNKTDAAMVDELHERQAMGQQIAKGIVNTLK